MVELLDEMNTLFRMFDANYVAVETDRDGKKFAIHSLYTETVSDGSLLVRQYHMPCWLIPSEERLREIVNQLILKETLTDG